MSNSVEKRARARELVLQLPDTIRVGAYDVDIVKWDAVYAGSKGSFGEFTSARLEIAICQDLPSPAKAAYTFLHELMHAIWFVFGLEEKEDEERVVTMLSLGWTQVHADNPWLLGWTHAALAGEKGAAGGTPAPAASATVPRQADKRGGRFPRLYKRSSTSSTQ